MAGCAVHAFIEQLIDWVTNTEIQIKIIIWYNMCYILSGRGFPYTYYNTM